jgi:hypothetical protein
MRTNIEHATPAIESAVVALSAVVAPVARIGARSPATHFATPLGRANPGPRTRFLYQGSMFSIPECATETNAPRFEHDKSAEKLFGVLRDNVDNHCG